MCLLIVGHRVHPDAPLVVAANRDEWLARPTRALGVLRDRDPRILGGRDELAHGTWLAINEHGVVAGLTNMPVPHGRDDRKRSRGELPLLLAQHRTAAAAAEALRDARPDDYNPCWLLVGDRQALFAIDMTAGDTPRIEELAAGLHIQENRPLGADSPKADSVRASLGALTSWRGKALVGELRTVLGRHELPDDERDRRDEWRPLELEAACVHAGPYGTRSATIVIVADGDRPLVHTADGPPCITPFASADFW